MAEDATSVLVGVTPGIPGPPPVTKRPVCAVSSVRPNTAVRLDEELHPVLDAVAAEFQNMELRSTPAADPANADPRNCADCSRTPKPPAFASFGGRDDL